MRRCGGCRPANPGLEKKIESNRLKIQDLKPWRALGDDVRTFLLLGFHSVLADLAARKVDSNSETLQGQVSPSRSFEIDSDTPRDIKVSFALRWLITRAIWSVALGLICLAESVRRYRSATPVKCSGSRVLSR